MPSPILAPIIIAAAGTAVATFFQNRSAKIAKERADRGEQLAKEHKRAEDIVKELDLLDLLFSLQPRARRFAESRSDTDDSIEQELGKQALSDYFKALAQWQNGSTRRRIEAGDHFGPDVRTLLKELGQVVSVQAARIDAAVSHREPTEAERTMEDNLPKDLKEFSDGFPDFYREMLLEKIMTKTGN